jgi:hypothetical protein
LNEAMMTKPTGRVCEYCGKAKGVTFHAMQTVEGRMRSVCAHLACFKKLRAAVERERMSARLLSAFREDER